MWILEKNWKDIYGTDHHRYFRYKTETNARKAKDRIEERDEEAECRIYQDITYHKQEELPF